MKKHLLFLIPLLSIACLVGCSNNETSKSEVPSSQSSSQQPSSSQVASSSETPASSDVSSEALVESSEQPVQSSEEPVQSSEAPVETSSEAIFESTINDSSLSSYLSSETQNESVSSSENNTSASSSNNSVLKPFKVYDVYLDDAAPDPCTFILEEYDDQTFSLDKKGIITNETYGTIDNRSSAVYIFDANNDGYRDFCTVKSDGSGVIYWYVTIYDLHNQKEIFKYWERPRNSYFLLLRENDLYVKQVNDYYTDETINEGKLSFDKDKGVYIIWNKNYDISDFDVKITYADPKHTPLTIKKVKDVYNVVVDDASQYFFDIDIAADTDYGEEYIPISFVMPANRFSISKVSKTNSLQRYCFFFADYSGSECTVFINVSNITKTFVFSIRSGPTYLTLGDVISWSKEVALDNITMFECEYESTLTSLLVRSRHITRYYDESSFSSALAYFNQIAFEISPDDFDFLTNEFKTYYTYRFYLGEQMYSYQAVSGFIEFNGKWYKMRSNFDVYASNRDSFYAFPSNIEETLIYNSDDTETGVSVDYLSDLIFSENSTHNKSVEDAKYYFVINDVKYYILSSKEFLSSQANFRYLYTIVSDKDFSSLFD